MKTFNIIIITLVVLFISATLSAGFFALSNFNSNFERVEETIIYDDFFTFEADDVSRIDAGIIAGTLSFVKHDQEDITIDHKGTCDYGYVTKKTETNEEIFQVKKEFNTITAKIKPVDFSLRRLFVDCEQTIIISTPQEFNGMIIAESVSGNILIDTYDIQQINVETVSGEVNVNSEVNTIETNSVSGNIFISSTKTIEHESVSGVIIIHSLENGDIETVSGDVELYLENGQEFSYQSVSGSIKGEKTQSNYAQIDVETVSGNLIIS